MVAPVVDFHEGFDGFVSAPGIGPSAARLGRFLSVGTKPDNTAVGRNGTGISLEAAGTDRQLVAAIPTASNTYIGGGYYSTSTVTNQTFFSTYDTTGGLHTSVVFDGSTGRVGVWRNGSAGTLVAQSDPGVFVPGEWAYWEWSVLNFTTTGGNFVVRKNETTVLSGSGDLTDQTGALINRVGWYLRPTGSRVDDIYVCRNRFLGDVVSEWHAPNADGTTLQWTPLSGTSHYQMIDEPGQDVEATYISAAAQGLTDLFYHEPVSSLDEVMCVSQLAIARYVTTAIIRLKCLTALGASEGVPNSLTVSYAPYVARYMSDPDTGGQWTAAKVNSTQFGVEHMSAGTPQMRVTAGGIEVLVLKNALSPPLPSSASPTDFAGTGLFIVGW